ncbi:hypothetical protein [Arthrobacter sp. C152]
MTENQWPQTPTPAPSDPYGTESYGAAEGSQQYTAYPADAAGNSKTQTAKEEASNVAGEAASAAQGVAHTAKGEAANVASEAKASAQDLLQQARTGLSSQAGTQQQKAAEGIRSISGQLHSMASAPDQQGVASDLIRQAAERTSSMATWLENREPGDLLNEVQRFARNRPGTFLLLAAGAGVLAGRLTRGLTAGAPDSQTQAQGQVPASRPQPATHSAPVAPIHNETVWAAGTDDLFDEPTVGRAAPVSTTTLPAGTAEDTPLRYEDDPYRGGIAGDAAGGETFGTQAYGTEGSREGRQL